MLEASIGSLAYIRVVRAEFSITEWGSWLWLLGIVAGRAEGDATRCTACEILRGIWAIERYERRVKQEIQLLAPEILCLLYYDITLYKEHNNTAIYSTVTLSRLLLNNNCIRIINDSNSLLLHKQLQKSHACMDYSVPNCPYDSSE